MFEIVEFGAEIWYVSFLAKYAPGPELFFEIVPPIDVAYLVIRAQKWEPAELATTCTPFICCVEY